MKICLLGDAQSIHLQRISAGLAQRSLQVHVVTHRPAVIPGVTVQPFRVPPAGLTNLRRWSARRDHFLRGLLRDFDLVHLHFLADWGFTAEMLSDATVAVTPWGSDITQPPGEGAPSEALLAARRMLLQNASLITAWGPRFARTIADYASVRVDQINVVPLGVDTQVFNRALYGWPADHQHPIVGFFKGFRPVYGASVFVKAMPRIAEAVPNVRCCMIGDGPEWEPCRQLALQSGMDSRIDWIARVPHRELPGHLARWQLSVIPSLRESFGLAALEASAMELPVVASDIGGLPDTVRHGVTGQLVPPADPAALADAIVALLTEGDLRRRMGRSGREVVERDFEWNDILDRWVRLYMELRARRCAMV